MHNPAGEILSVKALYGVYRHRLSAPLSASTMDIVPRTCLPTSYKRNEITSEPTPLESSQNMRARSTRWATTSTSTGPVEAAMCLPQLIKHKGCSQVGNANGAALVFIPTIMGSGQILNHPQLVDIRAAFAYMVRNKIYCADCE